MVRVSSSATQGNDRQSKSTVGSSDNTSPQPPKRKGKKEEVNLEKPKKGKQNVKLKNSPQISPNSGKFVLVIILLFLLIIILRLWYDFNS